MCAPHLCVWYCVCEECVIVRDGTHKLETDQRYSFSRALRGARALRPLQLIWLLLRQAGLGSEGDRAGGWKSRCRAARKGAWLRENNVSVQMWTGPLYYAKQYLQFYWLFEREITVFIFVYLPIQISFSVHDYTHQLTYVHEEKIGKRKQTRKKSIKTQRCDCSNEREKNRTLGEDKELHRQKKRQTVNPSKCIRRFSN
jgi:hypothetical protein